VLSVDENVLLFIILPSIVVSKPSLSEEKPIDQFLAVFTCLCEYQTSGPLKKRHILL